MTSFAFDTYSSLGSLGGSAELTRWAGLKDREVSHIGGSISNSSFVRSIHYSVEVERNVKGVELSLVVGDNNNNGGGNEVAASNNDWVDSEVRWTTSKFRTSSSLR